MPANISNEEIWTRYVEAHMAGMLANPFRSSGSTDAYCLQAMEYAERMLYHHKLRWP